MDLLQRARDAAELRGSRCAIVCNSSNGNLSNTDEIFGCASTLDRPPSWWPRVRRKLIRIEGEPQSDMIKSWSEVGQSLTKKKEKEKKSRGRKGRMGVTEVANTVGTCKSNHQVSIQRILTTKLKIKPGPNWTLASSTGHTGERW